MAYSSGGVTGAGGPSRGRKVVNIGRGLHAAEREALPQIRAGTAGSGYDSHTVGEEQSFWETTMQRKKVYAGRTELCVL